MNAELIRDIVKGGVGLVAVVVIGYLGSKFLEYWHAENMARFEIDQKEQVSLQQLSAAATQSAVNSTNLTESVKELVKTYTGN